MESVELRPAVKSADRVLDLFETLARWGKPMSHTELADELNIPKSSLSQLLQTLVSRGYLVFSPDRRGYLLGPSLLALAQQQAGGRDLVELARPALAALTAACKESSALYVLQGDESVVAAAVLGPQRLVMHMKEGDRAPLYATSGGKVLLAFLPEIRQEAYLSGVTLQRILPNTIHTVSALRREIAQVRQDGIAFVDEEFTEGIVGISVPIRQTGASAGTAVLGALNIAMPKARYKPAVRDEIVALLRQTSAKLERALS